MEKIVKDNYILFNINESSEKEIISFLSTELKACLSKNVIVDISKIDVSANTLLNLNELSDIHKENGMSFVTVIKNVSPEDVEETFTICPTLQEAEDIIAMENLERELGF